MSFLQKSPWLLYDAFLELERQTDSETETLLPPSSLCSSHFESKASPILTIPCTCTHNPFTLRFIFISLETDNESRDRNGRSRLSLAIGHAVAQRELQSPAPCSTLLNRCSGTAKHKSLPPPALHSTRHHSPSFNANTPSTKLHPLSHNGRRQEATCFVRRHHPSWYAGMRRID
jgi:hypothetical protein